ncbi:macrophage mannose receptor 1-like isoform X1 [Dinothrombium tinctorium]|uniref:Macrophage mannose receptor 1-like isoform X1 n=2 Tax=Dinothrombium tinctorium TaxID=1965070 RepID=A0A443RP57_9ACAR|nr:macrophage mannose receptor 1-like isoform X1 [Dinothrombium tinctorium]
MNASMVFIHSEEENDAVSSLTRNKEWYWIGLQEIASGVKDFAWLDESDYNFTKWRRNEPNLGNYNCYAAVIGGGEWWDHVCDQTSRALCQIDFDSDYKPEPEATKELVIRKFIRKQRLLMNKVKILEKQFNKDLFLPISAKISRNLALTQAEIDDTLDKLLIAIDSERNERSIPREWYWIGLQQLALGVNDFAWLDSSEFNYSKWENYLPNVRIPKHRWAGYTSSYGKWSLADQELRVLPLCQIDFDSDYVPRQNETSMLFLQLMFAKQSEMWSKVASLEHSVPFASRRSKPRNASEVIQTLMKIFDEFSANNRDREVIKIWTSILTIATFIYVILIYLTMFAKKVNCDEISNYARFENVNKA